MSLTRRQIDDELARIEANIQHLAVQLPSMLRDIHALREAVQARNPAQHRLDPPSPPGEDVPEQPPLGGDPT